MPAETMIVNESVKATKTAVHEGVQFVKKVWSIMDAAAEKKPPSDYLSPRAIETIQGKTSS